MLEHVDHLMLLGGWKPNTRRAVQQIIVAPLATITVSHGGPLATKPPSYLDCRLAFAWHRHNCWLCNHNSNWGLHIIRLPVPGLGERHTHSRAVRDGVRYV
jgi:hypothetical protein